MPISRLRERYLSYWSSGVGSQKTLSGFVPVPMEARLTSLLSAYSHIFEWSTALDGLGGMVANHRLIALPQTPETNKTRIRPRGVART